MSENTLSKQPPIHAFGLPFLNQNLTDNDQDSIFYNHPELDSPFLKNSFVGWRTRYLRLYERELQRSDSNVCGGCQFHYVQVKLSRVSKKKLRYLLYIL